MKYIATSELRTKSSKLIDTLMRGNSVSLIFRSRIIGEILPYKEDISIKKPKGGLRRFLSEVAPLRSLSKTERKERYSEHLRKKYGKNIS